MKPIKKILTSDHGKKNRNLASNVLLLNDSIGYDNHKILNAFLELM